MSCLCGCTLQLPTGHTYFATNDCVQRWSETNAMRPELTLVSAPSLCERWDYDESCICGTKPQYRCPRRTP